ncbi:MAG: alpha/beta fold hydrolase [Candidatus Omnitrophica bacterium]|nr:alpha/beta fold hydrolase [Candidatus Omnitrophota bacterium]
MPKVKLKDISLYYEVHGSGAPLLLISGLGADSSSWAGVVGKLSSHFTTILFDNRGTGRSGNMQKPYTVRRMADDAVKLLDHLKIERAHVIGHSMGGYIAQEIAINHPERVNKLVLEGTAPVSSKRNNALFHEFYKKLREKENFGDWIRAWTFWIFSRKTFASGSFVENFIKFAAEYPYPVSADTFKSQIKAIASFDTRDGIGSIKAKTLILAGKGDILITPEESGILAKSIHKSVFRLIDCAAHSMHVEDPKLFTGIVLEFLGID